MVRCRVKCRIIQADLPYDSDTQSSRLQEVLNTCLEVETGLEASAHECLLLTWWFLLYFSAQLGSFIMSLSCSILLKRQCCIPLHLSTLPVIGRYKHAASFSRPLFQCFSPLAETRVYGSTDQSLQGLWYFGDVLIINELLQPQICDSDNDKLLNDQELNDFQVPFPSYCRPGPLLWWEVRYGVLVLPSNLKLWLMSSLLCKGVWSLVWWQGDSPWKVWASTSVQPVTGIACAYRVFVPEQAVHTERKTWDHMENCEAVWLFQLSPTQRRISSAYVSGKFSV